MPVEHICQLFSMAKTDHKSKNVFNISRPGRYRCQIFHYHRKLSRLYLSVYLGLRDQPAFYLLFSDVAYIAGPMSWRGAEFDIAPKEDCIDLLVQVGLVGPAIHQFPDAYAPVTDYARLYTARSPESTIRIVASSATMLQSIPAEIQ